MRGRFEEGGVEPMKLDNEMMVIYFGTFQHPKNLSEVAEELYADRKDSVRTSFSRKKALEKMLEEELITAKKKDGWKYKANEEKLPLILEPLLEHEIDEIDELNMTEADLETLELMFENSDIRSLLENEKLDRILGSELSEARKQLSTYIKLLYVTLAGARIVFEDLSEAGNEKITLSDESAERLEGMLRLINFVSSESPLRIAEMFDEIMKTGRKIDLMELPRSHSKMINDLADRAKMFIEKLTGEDISNMVNKEPRDPVLS